MESVSFWSSALWTSLYSQPWTVACVSALVSHCCLEMPHWEQQCRGGVSWTELPWNQTPTHHPKLYTWVFSSLEFKWLHISSFWMLQELKTPAKSPSGEGCNSCPPRRFWSPHCWDCFEITPAVQSLLLVICLWELQMMTGRGLDSFVLILYCRSQRSIFCRETCGPAERTALFWALWRWCPLDPLSLHRTYKCRGRGSFSEIVFASHCTSGFLDGSS